MVLEEGMLEDREFLDISDKPSADDPSECLVEDREAGRSSDETTNRSRSKRESRRMRELEQATFSLQLLRVRTSSVGGPLSGDPDSSLHQHPPSRGYPASHGSFELLNSDEVETHDPTFPSGALQTTKDDLDKCGSPMDSIPPEYEFSSSGNPTLLSLTQEETPRATFYIPSDPSPKQDAHADSPSKALPERRESASRRPVVVVISMQKESPVEEGEVQSAPTSLEAGPSQPHRGVPGAKMPAALLSSSHQGAAPSTSEPGSSEVDIHIVLEPKAPAPSAPPSQERTSGGRLSCSPGLDPREVSRRPAAHSTPTNTISMTEKPPLISPHRRKLPFSK